MSNLFMKLKFFHFCYGHGIPRSLHHQNTKPESPTAIMYSDEKIMMII